MKRVIWIILILTINYLPAQERVYYADEVLVQASREKSGITLLPFPVHSTSGFDFLSNYYPDLSGLVLVSPSVMLSVNSRKNEIRPVFRSLQSENGSVLLNGIPIGNPWDDSFLLNEISSDMLQAIEFYPSGGDMSNPNQGITGGINIITRKARTPFELSSQIQTGSYGWKSGKITFGSKRGKLGFLLSGSHTAYKGAIKNTDYKTNNLSASLNYGLGRYGKLGLFSTFHSSDKGAWGNKPGEVWRFPFWQTFHTDLNYNVKLASRTDLTSRLFFSRWDNLLIAYNDSTMSTEKYRSLHHNKSFGAEFLGNVLVSKRAVMSLGVDSRENEMNTTNEGKKAINRGNAFVRGFYDMQRVVKVFIGTRCNFSDDFKWRLDYEGGLTIMPKEILRLKLHYSHLTRFPSLRQLYNETNDPSDHSNKNLRPTLSDNYEVTLEYEIKGKIVVSLTGFKTMAKDLVGTTPAPPPVRFRFDNIKDATLSGIEFALKGQPSLWLSIFANYAYNDGRDRRTNERLENLIYHHGAIGVQASVWRINPMATLTFRSEEPYRASNGEIKHLPGYYLVDAGIEARIIKHISAQILFKNITDKIYFVAENAQGQPREIRVGLNLNY